MGVCALPLPGPEKRICNAQVPTQLSLIKEVMPLIATLPSASARTAALAQVWHTVVQADLATRRAVRSGDKAVPGAQLKNILTEPFVMGIVSGTFTGDTTHSQFMMPADCAYGR